MKSFRQIKRSFLIRLMAVLGFGGMTAFCISSCQSSSNSDKQPKHEASENATPDASQTDADSNNAADADSNNAADADSNDAANTPQPVVNDWFAPQDPDIAIPVTKYGIQPPLPPDAYEHLDEMQVPPTPEANEERLKRYNDPDEDVPADKLKPEYTEEQLNAKPIADPEPVPTKYGVLPPEPPVAKYGIRPPVKKYGIPKPATRYGIRRDI